MVVWLKHQLGLVWSGLGLEGDGSARGQAGQGLEQPGLEEFSAVTFLKPLMENSRF